jgi:hypothetical protein
VSTIAVRGTPAVVSELRTISSIAASMYGMLVLVISSIVGFRLSATAVGSTDCISERSVDCTEVLSARSLSPQLKAVEVVSWAATTRPKIYACQNVTNSSEWSC